MPGEKHEIFVKLSQSGWFYCQSLYACHACPPLHHAHCAAQAPPEPVGPVPIPEPHPGHTSALLDMGFGAGPVRKALLLHRNELDPALEWLLSHGDEPQASVPLTDEQLQQVRQQACR